MPSPNYPAFALRAPSTWTCAAKFHHCTESVKRWPELSAAGRLLGRVCEKAGLVFPSLSAVLDA